MRAKRPFKLTEADTEHVSKLQPSSLALLIAADCDIGSSYAQLSAFFNIPLGTVKSRINRARNQIEWQRQKVILDAAIDAKAEAGAMAETNGSM